MAETRNLEGELVLWGRWWAQLETVGYELMGRLSSENDQWAARDMGINPEWGTGRRWAANLWVISPRACSPEVGDKFYASGCPARREEDPRVVGGRDVGGRGGNQRHMGNFRISGKLAGTQESLMLEMWKDKSFPRRRGWKNNEGCRKDSETEIKRQTLDIRIGNRWPVGAHVGKAVRVEIRFQGVKEGLGRKKTEHMNHRVEKVSVEKN